VSVEELRELLILTINRNTSTLDASAIEGAGTKSVVGVENTDTGDLFFLEIQEA
jgi:hypothetical protein